MGLNVINYLPESPQQVKIRNKAGSKLLMLVPDRKEELLGDGNVRNAYYYSKFYFYLCEPNLYL